LADKQATKKKRTDKYYDDVLNSRIRELMDSNKTRTEDFANKIGISSAAVRLWYTGYARPEIDKISAICDYFNVSADWLLGRSEAQSTNLEIGEICKKTGLSEKAVKNLMNQNSIKPETGSKPNFAFNAAREYIWFINSMAEGVDGAFGLTKLAHSVAEYVIMRHNHNVQFPNLEDGFEFVTGELSHCGKKYTKITGKDAFEIVMDELKRIGTKYTLLQGEESLEYYRFISQQDFIETISKLDEPPFSSTYTVRFRKR